MIYLLAKDFKLVFASGKAGKWRVVSYLLSALLVALFVAIEVYIVTGILSRLDAYVNAPIAFLSAALFIISILMILLCVAQAKKLFFNDRDIENLASMPVSNGQIILSKLLFLFLTQYVTELMFTYPVIVAYNALYGGGKMMYYLGLFYPLVAFPFECGVALLLVYPYKLLSDFLKKHSWIQFAVAVVVIFGLCYGYSILLNLFVTLVASNNFDAIINTDTVNAMVAAKRYMIPIGWLVGLFFEGNLRMIGVYLCVALGVFLLGTTVCIVSFNYLRSVRFHSGARARKFKYKCFSPTQALIKKEFVLLFKDSNNLFSFTGLILVQPFLVYLIVTSINTIFRSGIFAYYVALMPNFLPIIDMLMVILISLIISQGANSYISSEGKNIRLIKLLPVGILKQIAIKVALPLTFVTASALVSYAVLYLFGGITIVEALFGLLITLLIQTVFSIISLHEELQVRNNRSRSYFLSSTFSYVIPILYAAAMILGSYFGLDLYIAYVIGIAIVLASGLPWVIGLKKRVLRQFEQLEVVN